MSDELSAKMRTYLSEIYALSDRVAPENGYTSTSALADVLAVSAPAVNRMVNRLKDLGLLEHEPYQGIRLTPAGRAEALKHLRAQRIAESFLVGVMKMEWDAVCDEAIRLSNALSPMILERMYAMAGHPQVSPLGEPIPDAQGNIAHIEDMLLSETQGGSSVTITRLRTREAERLNYIQALGLVPGTTLDVLHVAPFDGPMQLKVGDEYRIIGNNLAQLIRVQMAADEAATPR